MLCFVDIEHDQILQNPERRNPHLASCMDIKLRLEEISGIPCNVQRYYQITRQRLHDWGVKALFISGNATDWAEYQEGDFDELKQIIREAEVPIMGFCGGGQLIAAAHGAPIGPMRPLRPNEKSLSSLWTPGYLHEWRYTPLHVVKGDPIFEGLSDSPTLLEVHYWEIKQAPAGFENLAASEACQIQLIKRLDRPVYGAQFHPEAYTEYPFDRRSRLVNLIYPDGHSEERSDGRRLLRNFFRIAGVLK